MSRESRFFLFKSNHFQKTHNIIKFGTNYCIFAPVGRWTNPPLRDHPSVPIWWGISLITGLWSPESRLSFARTTVTFTRTPGAVGMIISASIHCPEWFYGLFRTDSMPNLAFSDSFCFASIRMTWTSVLAGWCISWWATTNPRSQTMSSVLWFSSIAASTSSLSPSKVLAFVETHFLLPDSHACQDLKTEGSSMSGLAI